VTECDYDDANNAADMKHELLLMTLTNDASNVPTHCVLLVDCGEIAHDSVYM